MLWNLTQKTFKNIGRTRRDGAARIHLLSDVSIAVALVVAQAPYLSLLSAIKLSQRP